MAQHEPPEAKKSSPAAAQAAPKEKKANGAVKDKCALLSMPTRTHTHTHAHTGTGRRPMSSIGAADGGGGNGAHVAAKHDRIQH